MQNAEKNNTISINTFTSLSIIIGFFIAIYILQLGVMPLISQDETRYAEIAREMIFSGNWTVPTFNAIHYFEKPILGHWMNAISELIFGYNNFAVRFSSALTTGCTAIFLFFFMKKFSKSNELALIAPIIYLTFGLTLAIGTFSVLDSQTTFFITATLLSFFTAYKSENIKNKLMWLVLCGIAAGLSFLIKGFVSWAVIFLSIVPFLIWAKNWKRIFTMPWIPLIIAILVILPWGVAINKQAPDFWHYFIVVENIDRFTNASEFSGALHPEPFWFFIPIIIVGSLPWFLHIYEGIKGLKGNRFFQNSIIRFSAIWILFPFIFFSASSGKLATYILPCFVPLAILASYGIFTALDKEENIKIFDLINKLFAYLLSLALLLAIIYSVVGLCVHKIPTLWNIKQLPLGIVAIVFWIVMLKYSRKAKGKFKKIMLFAIAPIVAMSFKSYLTPNFALENNAFDTFIINQSQNIQKETKIAAYQDMVGAVCWTLKRDDIYIYQKPGEFQFQIEKDKYKNRFINNNETNSFIDKFRNSENGVAFFARTRDLKLLPTDPSVLVKTKKRVFVKYDTIATK